MSKFNTTLGLGSYKTFANKGTETFVYANSWELNDKLDAANRNGIAIPKTNVTGKLAINGGRLLISKTTRETQASSYL